MSQPAPPRPRPSRGRAFRAASGSVFRLRAIHPGDVAALQRAFARLTPEQVRQRTFHRMNELTTEAATRFAKVDPAQGVAFVVVDEEGEIRGEARFHFDSNPTSAEFAVITDPALAGQGLGRELMKRLVGEARKRGLRELWGTVLAQNTQMLEFSRRLGASRALVADEPDVVRVRFDLSRRLRRL
ncbi:MAG: N-acetyltransferase [Dokdonella sp.]|uniref:GNAT family N-acetyltransferase n=1 Tax=Dokdonella sp. TaxID=2291710 RepID=UPI0025B7F0EF|nr:GNAT family N-acetyltransferase [Dokdonella sp.]MBZ0223998.1 GNAT family N-acetyltransferase [Dokdonella sp.]MCC7254601.1 N-acetyltransferase [Dokdonella sp.]